MTKRELVIEVAERLGYTQNEVANVVQATLDLVTEALAKEQRIEIRNFGVFEVKKRAKRQARNPKTGDPVVVPEKYVVVFKPGREMEKRVKEVNEQKGDEDD